MPNVQQEKCLTEDCPSRPGDPKTYKGLCLKCYSAAKLLVQAGTTTWEQLAEMGMVLREESAFERAFKEKQGEAV